MSKRDKLHLVIGGGEYEDMLGLICEYVTHKGISVKTQEWVLPGSEKLVPTTIFRQTRSRLTTSSNFKPYMKFYSSQALGGHQNAHKKERTLARRAKRSSSDHHYYPFHTFPPPSQPPHFHHHHHQFITNPAAAAPVYITAHGGAHFRPFQGHQFFGPSPAPRFNNMVFFNGGNCSSPVASHRGPRRVVAEEDDEEVDYWMMVKKNKKGSLVDDDYVISGSEDRDCKNLDLSLHL